MLELLLLDAFFPSELVRQEEHPVKRLTLVLMVFEQTPEDREMRNLAAASFDERLKLESAAVLIRFIVHHPQQGMGAVIISGTFRISQ